MTVTFIVKIIEMEKLEHFTIDDIWSDFTKTTQMDEAIATAELKINDLIKGKEENKKGRFGFQGKYYDLYFVPENTPKECEKPYEFYEEKTMEDIIFSLFGVNSAYFYVTSKSGIDSAEARTVISILTSAANGCKVKFPFFVCIQKKEYMTFLGFSHEGMLHTHMCSYVDWKTDTPFTGFNKTKEIFTNSFKEDERSNVKLDSCERKFYQIERDDFGKKTHKEATLYSRAKKDPIQRIKFITQKRQTNEQSEKLDISNADKIVVQITPAKVKAEETRISKFVTFFYQTHEIAEFTRSSYDSDSMNAIESIWRSASQPEETSILKAAPKDSILCDLVVKMSSANNLIEACSMWMMFLKKVRSAFDSNTLIPGIETTGPQFENCIIYQKLQMINFCITQHDINKREFTESQETGKLLLNGKPMISPSTQTVTAKTEDQVQESEELLLKNYDDQVQKSKLQSRQLEADISAFKAENEGCCFEDFVRWYSPADYDEQKKCLSKRMSEEGNVWRVMYEKNKPIKAIDQVPLFNAAMEAELALDYLESLITGEVFGDLIAVVLAAAFFEIDSSIEKKVHANEKCMEEVKMALVEFHKEIELSQTRISPIDYYNISLEKAQIIEKAASNISFVNSLLQKFPECFDFVQRLIDDNVAIASNDKEMKTVNELMKSLITQEKKYRQRYDYVLSGTTDNLKQRVHVVRSFDKLGLPNHVVIASTIQEII